MPIISCNSIISESIIPQIIAKTGIKYVLEEANKAVDCLIKKLNNTIAKDVQIAPKIIK